MQTMAEFVEGYCKESEWTVDAFWQHFIVLPCACECAKEPHWAAIQRNESAIFHQLVFCMPEPDKLMAMDLELLRAQRRGASHE